MIRYVNDDKGLKAETFLYIANQVWPGSYNPELMERALSRTTNITAWDGDTLAGCLRILTDGYLFGTITELLVLPLYQKLGIGKALMERAAEISPTSLFFGAQPEAVGFYEKLGIERSLQSFTIRKKRRL